MKEYKITSQCAFYYHKYAAMVDLMQMYVREEKHERAVAAGIDAQRQKDKFYIEVLRLYPRLSDKHLTYHRNRKTVTVDKQ